MSIKSFGCASHIVHFTLNLSFFYTRECFQCDQELQLILYIYIFKIPDLTLHGEWKKISLSTTQVPSDSTTISTSVGEREYKMGLSNFLQYTLYFRTYDTKEQERSHIHTVMRGYRHLSCFICYAQRPKSFQYFWAVHCVCSASWVSATRNKK